MPKFKLEGSDQTFELPEQFKTVDEYLAYVQQQQQQLAQAQALAKQFEAWGDPATLQARLEAHLAGKIEETRKAMIAEGYTKKEAQKATDNIWEQWEQLTPQQQAEAQIKFVGEKMNERLTEMFNAKVKEADAMLANVGPNFQQQFDLLARMVDLKVANPKVDTAKIYGEMTKIAKADPNTLMDMALKNVLAPESFETRLAEERTKWQEEADKKAKAEKLNVLNSHDTPSWLKPKEERISINEPGGEDKLRVSILSKALENGTISPNQV